MVRGPGATMEVRKLIWGLIFGLQLWCATSVASASRMLTDELGRRVSLPDHPHRLVCLIPNAADSVYALGAGDDVIAVSDYTKYPEAARSKRSIGGPADPSLETIVSLHPDLAIGSGEFSRPLADHLEKLGVPVYVLAPHGIEGIYQSLLDLGRALGREQKAEEVVTKLRARVRAVQSRVQGAGRVPVFVLIWSDPITTVGHSAFLSELIELAGGKSITADLADEWPQMSLESLVARAPQALLLLRGGGVSFEDLERRTEWRSLPAVRDHRVYWADETLHLSSPSAIDGLEELARQFHPEDEGSSQRTKKAKGRAAGH
jgi:ABC-type Fe3+-hydroxamate transport system substrate-binding protein